MPAPAAPGSRNEMRAKMDRMRLKEAPSTVASLAAFNEIDVSLLVEMRQRPNPEGAQHQARLHSRVCSRVHPRAQRSPGGEHQHRGRLDRLSRLCRFERRNCHAQGSIEDLEGGSFTMFVLSFFSLGTCMWD